MEFRVLGPVEVTDGPRTIDLGSRMHRAMLSLLVVNAGRVVSLDRFIDCLWGDDPPASATNALQVYVSGLRKILEPERPVKAGSGVLVRRSPGYVLQVPTTAIDAFRFELLAEEGRALLDAGRPGPACDTLGRALGLWRGPPYEDLAFESFLQNEIARLNELRATTAEARAEGLLAQGHADEAVLDAERLVGEDPLRELRWELVALALYRHGRQGEALRALSRARTVLAEELGVEPGAALRRLERDILAQSPELEWRVPERQQSGAARRVPFRHVPRVLSGYGLPDGSAPAASVGRGAVLPPDECPFGFSLASMSVLATTFTMDGNNPARYPHTPFQILYTASLEVAPVATGCFVSGGNVFAVKSGTRLYATLLVMNDIPPVIGTFPETPDEARAYFLDDALYGGRDFEVVVDGVRTAIDADYLAGPVSLPDLEGIRVVTLGAFLGPLGEGTHTVTVRGGIFGAGVAEEYDVSFLQINATYTIDVRPDT